MKKVIDKFKEYCLKCDELRKDGNKVDIDDDDYYNEGDPTVLGVDLGNKEDMTKRERDKFYSRRYRRDLKNKSIMPVYRMRKMTKKKIKIGERIKILDGKIEKLKEEMKNG